VYARACCDGGASDAEARGEAKTSFVEVFFVCVWLGCFSCVFQEQQLSQQQTHTHNQQKDPKKKTTQAPQNNDLPWSCPGWA
jgi:hypothetical protein